MSGWNQTKSFHFGSIFCERESVTDTDSDWDLNAKFRRIWAHRTRIIILTFWAMGPSICACLHECIFFKLVEEGKSLSILLDNYFIIYGQVWRYWHPSKMLIKPHFGINKSMFIHNYINGQINRVKVDSAFIFLHHNYRNIFRSFPLFETLFYIDN